MIELVVRLQSLITCARNVGKRAREREGRGATSVEYALMAGTICVGIIASYALFTAKVAQNFNKVPTTWV